MATATSSTEMERNNTDAAKLELYRLPGVGYKAMHEDRVSSFDDVCGWINKRRAERD